MLQNQIYLPFHGHIHSARGMDLTAQNLTNILLTMQLNPGELGRRKETKQKKKNGRKVNMVQLFKQESVTVGVTMSLTPLSCKMREKNLLSHNHN